MTLLLEHEVKLRESDLFLVLSEFCPDFAVEHVLRELPYCDCRFGDWLLNLVEETTEPAVETADLDLRAVARVHLEMVARDEARESRELQGTDGVEEGLEDDLALATYKTEPVIKPTHAVDGGFGLTNGCILVLCHCYLLRLKAESFPLPEVMGAWHSPEHRNHKNLRSLCLGESRNLRYFTGYYYIHIYRGLSIVKIVSI